MASMRWRQMLYFSEIFKHDGDGEDGKMRVDFLLGNRMFP